MNIQTHTHLFALEIKLQLLAQGQSIGLTPEEAAIYGIEDADVNNLSLMPAGENEFYDEAEFPITFTTKP